ncbi:MAG TPA: tetratricopeptide repeat protein [Candidatus Limnocylindrales bacterium]
MSRDATPSPDDPRQPHERDDAPAEPAADREGADREGAYELLQRGQALMRGLHHAQAAIVLRRAARIEPGKASILEALARALYNSGQHAQAAEAFEALLEVDPSAHYGHFGLGLSFKRLGRQREARTHLRLAVALDPRSAVYRRELERLGPLA